MTFWAALEDLSDPAAVAEYWRSALGAEFAPARPFLTPAPALATTYPDPDGGPPWAVVTHGPGDLVAVCPESGRTRALTRDDAVVLRVDPTRLGRAVALAFGLSPPPRPAVAPPRGVPLGRFAAADGRDLVALFALPNETHDVLALGRQWALAEGRPVLLAVPTRRYARRHAEGLLRASGSFFVPLDEALEWAGPGAFRARRPLAAFWADAFDAGDAVTSRPAEPGAQAAFTRGGPGGFWSLAYAGREVQLPDAVGLQYLWVLVQHPGRPLSLATLCAAATGRPSAPYGGDELIDDEGLATLKARATELAGEIGEARGAGDMQSAESLTEELRAVTAQVQAAQGLAGRPRKLGDRSDSLRTSVQKAIERAVGKIRAHHPKLADHFAASVTTGQEVTYAPDPPVDWSCRGAGDADVPRRGTGVPRGGTPWG